MAGWGAVSMRWVVLDLVAGSMQLKHRSVWVRAEQRGVCRREAEPNTSQRRCLNSLSLKNFNCAPTLSRHRAVDSDGGDPCLQRSFPD